MNILNKLFKRFNLFIGVIILTALFMVLFLIMPIGINDRKNDQVTKIYYADNISDAHELLIDHFNQKYKGKIKVIPVNLPFTKFNEVQGYDFSLKNNAIFVRGWPGFLQQHNYSGEDSIKFHNMEEAALPHFKDGKTAFVYGGWNFMISKFSENKKAAAEFIRYSLRKENQELMFEEGGYIPIHRSVYEDSIFVVKHPDIVYYRDLLKKGVHRSYHVDYTKISDVISYYVHLAIKNEISVSEALNRATELINSKQVLIK